jgi:hypothetical protein
MSDSIDSIDLIDSIKKRYLIFLVCFLKKPMNIFLKQNAKNFVEKFSFSMVMELEDLQFEELNLF